MPVPHKLQALFYRAWGRLPPWLQDGLVFVGAAKATLGAAAIILDHEGRVLLVHHTYGNPAWSVPGGLIGRREQPAAALARELREELGVAAAVGPVMHVQHETWRRHVTIYYRVAINGAPRPNGVENDAVRYVAPVAFAGLMDHVSAQWLQGLVQRAVDIGSLPDQ